MRFKVAAEWIDAGPRIMQAMDYPLHERMFTSTTIEVAPDGEPDARSALYSGSPTVTGRVVSVREEE